MDVDCYGFCSTESKTLRQEHPLHLEKKVKSPPKNLVFSFFLQKTWFLGRKNRGFLMVKRVS